MNVERVVEVTELQWGFDDAGPRMRVGVTKFCHTEKVDPAPAYGHDPKLVARVLAECEAAFPVPHPPTIFLLNHEEVGRTNGATTFESDYDDSKKEADGRYVQIARIVLSGKRIPIHPAMTRYLVAHEYGHVVDTVLALRRYKGANAESEQDAEYVKVRGLMSRPAYYGPGTWHLQVGELFANDFRILVVGAEREFWPHPGIARPEDVPAVKDWWDARLAELGAQAKAA